MFEIDITNSASLRTFTDFASADDSNYLEGDVVLVEGHGFRKKAGSTTGRKSGWEPSPFLFSESNSGGLIQKRMMGQLPFPLAIPLQSKRQSTTLSPLGVGSLILDLANSQ